MSSVVWIDTPLAMVKLDAGTARFTTLGGFCVFFKPMASLLGAGCDH